MFLNCFQVHYTEDLIKSKGKVTMVADSFELQRHVENSKNFSLVLDFSRMCLANYCPCSECTCGPVKVSLDVYYCYLIAHYCFFLPIMINYLVYLYIVYLVLGTISFYVCFKRECLILSMI